ncbi:MAG: kinase [Rhodospirillales bacterium]|nr:kinase [Rhodospirillales bacterium]
MIISKTPFRVSLFGGGTDYPAWYREHGGSVIGTTIDKYCYLSVRYLPPFFEHKHRVVWSNIELINEIGDIEHPAVRAILEQMGFDKGLEISYNADLPARSGLGTSSSFSVGLLNALYALRGKMITKNELADEAIRIEQDVIGEAVGSQDQIWAAHGGLNRIDFHKDGSYEVSPLIISHDVRDSLKRSFMLFFTGFARTAAEIAEKQIANFSNKKKEIGEISQFCDDASTILQGSGDPIKELGLLMHQSWQRKRSLADGVSSPAIDEIYNAGLEAGAYGGKILGAGGGGFMLFLVDPERRAEVRDRLSQLIHVNFDLDTGGSKIVVFEPDEAMNGDHAPS